MGNIVCRNPQKPFSVSLCLCGFLLYLSSASSVRAQSAVELRFEDLPRLVAEKNQAVTGADRLVESARARTGHLGRAYLPSLGVEAGGERFQTLHYGWETQPYGHAEARLNLFRGGRDRLSGAAFERQVELASADAKKSLAAELAAARRTYWELVSDREKAKLVEVALDENEKLLAVANRRINRGLATETDRLEFEISRSLLREELESLLHATLLLQIRLSAALGLPPESRFKTPETIEHDHDERLLAAPFDAGAHPDARALEAQGRALDLARMKAEPWRAPSLDLYGGYYLYTLRERDSTSRKERDDKAIGIQLSIPLFDGLRSRTEAKALRLEAEGVNRQKAQRILAVDAEVRVAKEDLKHDHELIHYAETRIEQGTRYLALTLDEYERGVKNSLDALGAAQRQLGYRRQYAERRRDYQITKSGLLALLGQ